MSRTMPRVIAVTLLLALPIALPSHAEETKPSVKSTVKEGARTGGHAARDGLQTFGRSIGAFFRGGPKAAKEIWKANAARTRANAKAGAGATRHAAQGD
jgi:hypothetical protein